MTNKKVELQEENLENVNGGFLLTLIAGGLIIKKVIDSKKKNTPAPAAPAAPTSTNTSVTNNRSGGNQNINSGKFTNNTNSPFGGGSK